MDERRQEGEQGGFGGREVEEGMFGAVGWGAEVERGRHGGVGFGVCYYQKDCGCESFIFSLGGAKPAGTPTGGGRLRGSDSSPSSRGMSSGMETR